MKWGIAIVALIIAGALYYFWQESHFSTRGERQPATQIQAEVKTRMSEKDPPKVIPEGVIMEDGTI
jgi:hypothetical protein